MEGRTIARPDRCRGRTCSTVTGQRKSLQWRAGQLPGQTTADRTCTSPGTCLQWRAGQLPGQTGAATQWLIWPRRRTFNGGPDNCPARRADRTSPQVRKPLQWRAGQLPGQTAEQRRTAMRAGPCMRLQWRAGQLPGQTWPLGLAAAVGGCGTFNGGPDNCPARPGPQRSQRDMKLTSLQWRAGQLPGQTRRSGVSMRGSLQWRAGPASTGRGSAAELPSMEGRTIARPDA